MNPSWILLYTCPDAAGVQAFVSTFIYEHGGFVDESKAYSDAESGQFVSRIAFHAVDANAFDIEAFKAKLSAEAQAYKLEWTITSAEERMPTIIAVSQSGHCFNDLLHRWKIGSLPKRPHFGMSCKTARYACRSAGRPNLRTTKRFRADT